MAVQKPQEDADSEKTVLLVLAQSLNDMRDVLVGCSLMLHDIQFQLDAEQRNASTEHLKSLIEKINAR